MSLILTKLRGQHNYMDLYNVFDTVDGSVEVINEWELSNYIRIIDFDKRNIRRNKFSEEYFKIYSDIPVIEFGVSYYPSEDDLMLNAMLSKSVQKLENNKDTYYIINDDKFIIATLNDYFYIGYDFAGFVHYILSTYPDLKILDFSRFHSVSKINMQFSWNDKLEYIDLSNIRLDEECLLNMFTYCKNLRTVKFNKNFELKPESISGMFAGCENLEYLDLSMINLSDIDYIENVFKDCLNLKEVVFQDRVIDLSILRFLHFFNNCKIDKLDMSMFFLRDVNKTLRKDVNIFMNCEIKYLDIRNMDLDWIELLRIKGLCELYVSELTYNAILTHISTTNYTVDEYDTFTLYCCSGSEILDSCKIRNYETYTNLNITIDNG